jgi:hypothetical protein
MPRVSIDRARGLPDIMAASDFEFILGTIPGGTSDRDMVVKCQQVSYPGMGQEAFEVPLHGHVMYFRGRKTFPRNLSVTYLEDRTMDTTNQLESWFEYIVGTNSGTSAGYKRSYALDGPRLITYDTTGRAVKSVVFYGLQPQDKPDVQYDGSSSAVYTISATFVYDFYEASGIALR